MRMETREVKETKFVYIAEDDTEFYNKDECERYEIWLKNWKELLESSLKEIEKEI